MASDLALSIVIPTHNRPVLMRRAVESALASLPVGGEVVLIDDASDPPAAPALEDARLRVLRNQGVRGAGGARNFGVDRALGAVILFLDDDDLMLPDYPERVLGAARQGGPDWGFAATCAHAEGQTPRPVGNGAPRLLTGGPFRHRLAGLGCGFWIRREVFRALGGIDVTLSVNEDTEFSIRLLASGRAPLYDPVPGVSLLRHGGDGVAGQAGQITLATAAGERARCFRSILERHRDWLAADAGAERHILRRLVKQEAKLGRGVGTALTEGRWSGRPANALYALANLIVYRLRGVRR